MGELVKGFYWVLLHTVIFVAKAFWKIFLFFILLFVGCFA